MNETRTRLLLGLVLLAISLAVSPSAMSAEDGAMSPERVLERAFANLYSCATLSAVEMQMWDRFGATRRLMLESATLEVDGERRVLGYVTEPSSLRGTKYLVVERNDGEGGSRRDHDAWVYMPHNRRTRRITTAHDDDAFLGSDFTYEDFQRREVRNFDVVDVRTKRVQGEVAYVVDALSNYSELYDRALFAVARSDHALLEIRFFRKGSDAPFRLLKTRRSRMRRGSTCIAPTWIRVEQPEKGTATEIRFVDLKIDPQPPLEARLFEPGALERPYTSIPRNGQLTRPEE